MSFYIYPSGDLNAVFIIFIRRFAWNGAVYAACKRLKNSLSENIESRDEHGSRGFITIAVEINIPTAETANTICPTTVFISELYQALFSIYNKLSNPDITAAILDMKTKIDNEVFHEWCDSLILCQSDRSLKKKSVSYSYGYTNSYCG